MYSANADSCNILAFLDFAVPGQSEAVVHAKEGFFCGDGPIGSGPGIAGEKVIRLGYRPGFLFKCVRINFIERKSFCRSYYLLQEESFEVKGYLWLFRVR